MEKITFAERIDYPETYLGSSRTSMMKVFEKIVNGFKPLTVSAINSIEIGLILCHLGGNFAGVFMLDYWAKKT